MNRVLTAGFMLALASVLGPDVAPAAGLERAPELTLEDIYGKELKIGYAGAKLTLVNFWAVWCLPCHEEMPQIAAMVRRYKDDGFRAVGITLESGEPEDVRGFLAENPEMGINYPILMGTPEATARFGDVLIVPTSFLIDSGGRILKTYIGVSPDFGEDLENQIKSVLSGKHASGTESQTAPSTDRD